MRREKLLTIVLLVTGSVGVVLPASAAGLDHSAWDAILKQYVNSASEVDYRGLKERGQETLDAYVGELAGPWPPDMVPAAEKAALINAYNALTIKWIVANYPVESIWQTDNPFQTARHRLDQDQVSLDEIESRLKQMEDPRFHAALVCAARSCPPLCREAYVSERIDEQLDDNIRRWLADPSLNEFNPQEKTARISKIFQWYEDDFHQDGGLKGFLARYAPPGKQAFLKEPDLRIEYQDYDWGLNDSAGAGSGYSRLNLYWDWLRNRLPIERIKTWFLSLGREHGVNPFVFGAIYIGAIPFFSLSVAWLIRNLKRGQSPVLPALCAGFCFISAYLYLLVAGQNIPAWVYVFIAAMLVFGAYSTVRKVRSRLREESHT